MNQFKKAYYDCTIGDIQEQINNLKGQVHQSINDYMYYSMQLIKEEDRLKELTEKLHTYQSA